MADWYLLYTKPRQERIAVQGLEEQGYLIYWPRLRIKRRRKGGKVEVEEPLFPRYLFVARKSDSQAIGPARFTRGIQKLIKFGDTYLTVSDEIVESIRRREDPVTGFHRLTMPAVSPGDRVRIKTGPFAGIDGIFEARSGDERVIVLLEILGQQTRTEVSLGELET